MDLSEMTLFLLAIGLLLLVARVLGELARLARQPAVLGEMTAGLLLGPSVLGRLAPDVGPVLFPTAGAFHDALYALTTLGIILYMLVAGIEIDLSSVLRQGRAAAVISVFGILVPFALGFAGAWYWPGLFGANAATGRLVFSLFLGTALAISALPVIAKILFDLGMYRSDFGMLVVSVAVIDDLAGWMMFAVVLGMLGQGVEMPFGVAGTIGLTLAFAFVMLTVGRTLVDRAIPRVQAYSPWPGGVLTFAIVGGLLCGAFTEWIGVHAIFGAFIFGVALGDSPHLRERTKAILDHFISFIFAPLFFASIGLGVDFVASFNPGMVVAVFVLACVGKLLGSGFAGRMTGVSIRDSLAIGFGMNARGAMAIILALLALQARLINEELFVALVVMSLATSMIAGSAMQALLGRNRPARLLHCLSPRSFAGQLRARSAFEAIEALATAAANVTPIEIDADAIAGAVIEREALGATSLEHGIAVPHARLAGLTAPVVAVGLSRSGVDFDAPDGGKSHVIVLILTPEDDQKAQLELLADVAKTFANSALTARVLATNGYVELLAALRSASST